MGPKVKKTTNKQQRRKERASRVAAGKGRLPASVRREDAKKKGKRRRALVAALTEAARGEVAARGAAVETAEQVRQRQAVEWREMKAKVAQLKKQRQRLPKKGSKDEKVAVAQQIRLLISEMQVKHEAELRAMGLHVTGGDGKAAEADAMSDD
eukprot:CAMPEP_0179107552 /NCGR_PEP_ID=MMETSP0796-20121207/50061_1 /TAXON_ID=73915 /ORGANISM="Pyrodinium bahamense, Strain pbaha01" /LENGTH=152 /DNA_ID=CAMNT_0020805611 /DNA_START=71 /DNA_END=529 /DNA_ORIENTATION=+